MRLNPDHFRSDRDGLPFGKVNLPGNSDYRPERQRHHLIPRQILTLAPLRRMIGSLGVDRLGIHDFRRNGQLLPSSEREAVRAGLPLHRGPHPAYNELVIERIGQIEAGWSRDKAKGASADYTALMRFDLLQRALRRRFLDPRSWSRVPLNARDPALDFSHLDVMADLFWTDTSQIALAG